MEALFIILVIAILAHLAGAFRTPPPQIIYVQAVTPQPRGGFGCLLWLIALVVLLIVLGVISV